MPVLGLVDPIAGATTSAVLNAPDPMHGSFMMLHLGVGAPIAALVAWLLFGAILGVTAGARPSDHSVRLRRTLRGPALAVAASIVAVIAIELVVVHPGVASTSSVTGTRMVATEPAQALPSGADFFSVLELSQTPGAQFGPHSHLFSGFAYGVKGVATITFDGAQAIRIAPGEAGFIGTLAVHSHNNADDRLPSAALALLIVALAAAVCLIWFRPARRAGRLLPVALVLLIAAGAIGTWNPWSNDWLFFSVRAVGGRGAPMPLPTATRIYESPDLVGLPPGPYVQTLDEITVAAAGAIADVGSAGSGLLFELDGQVQLQQAGGSSVMLGARRATLLQPGVSVQAINSGDQPAHLLRLDVTPTTPVADSVTTQPARGVTAAQP